MNNNGNRHAPRFTSLSTKKLTKYRRKMLSTGGFTPPSAGTVTQMPALAAMPEWFARTLAAIARARDAVFSRAEHLSNRQRRAQGR